MATAKIPPPPEWHEALMLRITDPVLRKVVEHHKPLLLRSIFTGRALAQAECDGCDPGDYAESRADWPCSTIELIEEALP